VSTPKNSDMAIVAMVLRYEMSFCGSIKAVVLFRDDDADQIPVRPLPVAAVEPGCGLLRLGRDSPLTAGVEAGVGALAAAGALAVVGEEALLDEGVAELEPPPPPPQAVRTSDASRDNANVALFFISVCFIWTSAAVKSASSCR